ncbi:MAG: hypothetical protein ACE5O2_05085 [Armatimonadota bacterium]
MQWAWIRLALTCVVALCLVGPYNAHGQDLEALERSPFGFSCDDQTTYTLATCHRHRNLGTTRHGRPRESWGNGAYRGPAHGRQCGNGCVDADRRPGARLQQERRAVVHG